MNTAKTPNIIRDKRLPIPKNEHVTKSMRGNKSKNTKPELQLRKALWHAGLRGYRVHYNKIPGKPDIVFVSKKLAVFVHGCFWHRCPTCNYKLPKHNTAFWKDKFEKNIERDAYKKQALQKLGWKVLTLWECDFDKGVGAMVYEIRKEFDKEYE